MSATMAQGLDDISRLIGGIERSLLDLGRRFDRIEARMDERDDTLNDIQNELSRNSNDTRYLKELIVSDVKPVTDEVKRWKIMGMGALGIIGVGGTAFGAAVLWILGQLGWVKLP